MRARERTLAIAVGALVGLWLVDAVAIEPALGWYRGVVRDGEQSARRVAEARVLVDRAPRIRDDWRSRHAAGLLDEEDQARYRLQETIATAARRAGVAIDSAGGGQRVPAAHGTAYDTLRLSLSAQGSLTELLAFCADLEGAAMPLSIERGELAARDARKDQVDLALTVSTRLVAAKERAARRVPADAPAWKPPKADGADRALVVAAQPFLAERRRAAKPVAGPAPAPTGGTWGVVGIIARDGAPLGFLRHTGDGSERQVLPGDALPGAAGTVAAITPEGLRVAAADGAERTLAVGSDLTGQPLAAAAPSTTPSAAGTTAAPAGDRDAILQRLRQKRNRTH